VFKLASAETPPITPHMSASIYKSALGNAFRVRYMIPGESRASNGQTGSFNLN
jgi:hypothetical protein